MEIVLGGCERDPNAAHGGGSWYWWVSVMEAESGEWVDRLANGYADSRDAGLTAADTAAHGLGYSRSGGDQANGHEYRKGSGVQS